MTLNISRTVNAHDPQPHPTVADVQSRLIHRGYSVGVYGADGSFGHDTEVAVRRFQAQTGLVSDGIVGTATWGKLVQSRGVSEAVIFAEIVYDRVMGLDGAPRPRYLYGGKAHDLNDKHPAELDCSGAVSWGMYQEEHTFWKDGTWAQANACRIISVTEASETKGALLFVSSNGLPSGAHHVAVSMGSGVTDARGTAEARSSASGCGSWPIGNRFTFGGLPYVLSY